MLFTLINVIYSFIEPGSNDAFVVGNITNAKTTSANGRLKSSLGNKMVIVDKEIINENLTVLKESFVEYFKNKQITEKQKDGLKKIIDRAVHGDQRVLDKLVEKGVISSEASSAIVKRTYRHVPSYEGPHIHVPKNGGLGVDGGSRGGLDGSSSDSRGGSSGLGGSGDGSFSGNEDISRNDVDKNTVDMANKFLEFFNLQIDPLRERANSGDREAMSRMQKMESMYDLSKNIANGNHGLYLEEFRSKMGDQFIPEFNESAGYSSMLFQHRQPVGDVLQHDLYHEHFDELDPIAQGKKDMDRELHGQTQSFSTEHLDDSFRKGMVYPEGLNEQNLREDLHMTNEEIENLETTNLTKGAYDKARESGLDHMAALANSDAALNYVRSIEVFKKQGYKPFEAEEKARKLYKNIKHILPNDQDLIEERRNMVVEEAGISNALHPQDLFKGFSSNDLAKALQNRKELEERRHVLDSELAMRTKQSMYENNLKHKLAEEHEKMAEEEIKKARELRESTLETQYEKLEKEGDPKLRTPEVKAKIAKKRDQYLEMLHNQNKHMMVDGAESDSIYAVGKIVKNQSAEQLMKQNRIDKEIRLKNAKIVQADKEKRVAEKQQREREEEEIKTKMENQKILEEQKKQLQNERSSQYDNTVYKAVMQEQEEAKQYEESKALHQMEAQVAEAKNIAYNNVISLGGSEAEASDAANKAASVKSEAFKTELNQIIDEHTVILGTQMDSNTARSIAEHIAVAHSGLNTVGNSAEEIEHRESSLSELMVISDETLGVIRVLSDDVDEVELTNVEVKLPFTTVPNIKARTEEEEHVKIHQAKLREFLRNKITKSEFNSGLKVFKARDGFFNASESATGIYIQSGRVKVSPEGFELMKRDKMDITPFHPKITKDGTFYEAKVEDMKMKIPTDFDPDVPKLLANKNESIDFTHADRIEIDIGKLLMTPWNEFMAGMRPEVHQVFETDTEIVSEEARQKFEAMERQQKLLQETQIKTFTNPEGAAYADMTPAYGMTHRMGIHDAIEKLEGEEKATAEMLNENVANNLNMEDNVKVVDSLDQFMENVKSKHLSSKNTSLISNLDSKNPLTQQENSELSSMINKEARLNKLIEVSMRSGNSTENIIFNNIIQNSKSLASSLNMSQSKFIQQISHMSSSSIQQMAQFYVTLSNSTNSTHLMQTMSEQPWFQSLKSTFPSVSTSTMTTMISMIISNVTHIVNPASASIVSRIPLPPNTQGVVGTDANGQPTKYFPAKDGSQVIGENRATGPNPAVNPNYTPANLPSFSGPSQTVPLPVHNNSLGEGAQAQNPAGGSKPPGPNPNPVILPPGSGQTAPPVGPVHNNNQGAQNPVAQQQPLPGAGSPSILPTIAPTGGQDEQQGNGNAGVVTTLPQDASNGHGNILNHQVPA